MDVFVFLFAFVVSFGLLASTVLTRHDIRALFGGSGNWALGSPGTRAARKAPKAKEEPAPAPKKAKEEPAEAAAEEPPPPPVEEEEAQPEGDASGASVALMKFLEGSVAHLIKSKVELTAADKFGANLFLAGAVEVIRLQNKLNKKQFVELLERTLAVIGNKKEVAQRLADKYEEYLLEAQYIRMFHGGTTALERFLKGNSDSIKSFTAAVLDWRNPKDQMTKADGPITVMFTDIVGSTKATQQHGDEGGQRLVRAHNAVVRVALKENGGIEVKHTGDGIMARFSNSANAVDASLQIIKGMHQHNRDHPNDLQLHMRVGLNAGEPIIEDGDLFGATVQMAARICDAADTDHCLVSNIVRELCSGKPITFKDAGRYAMKGIEHPVTLFEPIAR